MAQNEREWWSVDEIAKAHGMTRSVVYKMVDAGLVKAEVTGKRSILVFEPSVRQALNHRAMAQDGKTLGERLIQAQKKGKILAEDDALIDDLIAYFKSLK